MTLRATVCVCEAYDSECVCMCVVCVHGVWNTCMCACVVCVARQCVQREYASSYKGWYLPLLTRSATMQLLGASKWLGIRSFKSRGGDLKVLCVENDRVSATQWDSWCYVSHLDNL